MVANNPQPPSSPRQALFPTGQLLATPGALAALTEAGQNPTELLARHQSGDWGEVDGEDAAANDRSVKDGSRILSAYTLKSGVKVWVISESDRSATTILLPDEY